MSEKRILRCAIYTRKSTEEGLDMDYNTLDAQREAGEKYIEAIFMHGQVSIPTKVIGVALSKLLSTMLPAILSWPQKRKSAGRASR